MNVCKGQALEYLNKHKQLMQDDATFEEEFVAAVKKSPSKHSVECAIFAAVDAGWYKALKELLSIDLATHEPVQAKEASHPQQDQIVAKLDLSSVQNQEMKRERMTWILNQHSCMPSRQRGLKP